MRVEPRPRVEGGGEGRGGHDDGRGVPLAVRADLHHELAGGAHLLVSPSSLQNCENCRW